MAPFQSFLDIVAACDNYRIDADRTSLTTWRLTARPTSPAIGVLRPEIVTQLRAEDAKGSVPAWEFATHEGRQVVGFSSHIHGPSARTRVMKELCERWRDEGRWPDVIGPRKWRNEMYAVYRNPFGVHDALQIDDTDDDEANYAFMMERSACALFGVVTYGVHMSIFEEDEDRHGALDSCRISKQTWPGYLDNTVAGGIPCGLGAFESLVKESMEEASLAEDVVRTHARAAGTISYFFRYVYDLRIPTGADPEAYKPTPLDGEVESFDLLSLAEVVSRMQRGLFKPNTALVILDFMIRRGKGVVPNGRTGATSSMRWIQLFPIGFANIAAGTESFPQDVKPSDDPCDSGGGLGFLRTPVSLVESGWILEASKNSQD
ncbi:predicted protein [Postia placenta Mad-698-R]|uniref:Nudix hydrolase domain-containing protein n=1 Tax=Postia placenta MAD-698-R-SB12 TaxID=670580 RepID=A0A1X6MKJ2_9APHY|nr:hypothetical protein POSPLADRAFT_1159045 [Postia placenta MAD-698-R-SB12]EED80277.1 predicted protein [Postia placenta Mad-698-R]OSX56766.1 hypothetical protein POSPLADRAFT_1159045 [Postia placenta MAD-698-R-SB12]